MDQPPKPRTNDYLAKRIYGGPAGAGLPERFEISKNMSFEEFENLARLYVVWALEDGEEEAFQEARADFGERAEEVIAEFHQLNAVFALSLRPHPPHPDTKRKLLDAIRQSMQGARQAGGDPRLASKSDRQ